MPKKDEPKKAKAPDVYYGFDVYSALPESLKCYVLTGDIDLIEKLKQEVRLYDVRINDLLEVRNGKIAAASTEEKGAIETVLKIDAEISRIQRDKINALSLIQKLSCGEGREGGLQDLDININIDGEEF